MLHKLLAKIYIWFLLETVLSDVRIDVVVFVHIPGADAATMDEAIKVEVPSEPPLPYRNPHVGAQDPTQVPNLQMPFYHNNQSQRTFHPQGPFKEDDSPSMSSLPFHSQSTNLPFPQPAPSYSTAPPSSLLRELNLFPVHLDDWILLQRSTFDYSGPNPHF